jgi:hypothetical protein
MICDKAMEFLLFGMAQDMLETLKRIILMAKEF